MLTMLVSVRCFPFTPNWFVNLACPIVGIPVEIFFLSLLLGLIPYNYLTCQVGET